MTKLEEFKKDLTFLLVTARKPLVWLESFDYAYIIKTLKEVFYINKDVEEKDIAIWNIATCLITDINGNKMSFVDNKVEKTQIIKNNSEQQTERTAKNAAKLGKRVAMFRSMPNKDKNNSSLENHEKEKEMKNPLTNIKLLVAKVSEELFEDKDDRLVARLQDFVVANNDISIVNKKTILLISTYHFDVKGLEHICERLELPMPDKDDIRQELHLNDIDEDDKKEILFSKSFKIDSLKNSDMLVDALHGMYLYDIVNLLKTIQIESKFGKIAPFDYNYGKLDERVKQGKRQIVKNSGLLEVIEIKDKNYHEHIADIDNLRDHLRKENELLHSQRFLQSNLPRPRGILLVGAPGCGKSESAKATASILDFPLYRMNIGDLMGHKYGQSENRFNEALRTADGSAPCVLWIDEIEKAFAGAGNGDDNNDVLTHIIGRFLTWMQEHQTIVYLVATANDLSQMRPELLRKGRWDEIFYLSYPGSIGRLSILKKCFQRYGLKLVDNGEEDLLDFNDNKVNEVIHKDCYKTFLTETKYMSGSDIASIVTEIAKDTYRENNEIKNVKIIKLDAKIHEHQQVKNAEKEEIEKNISQEVENELQELEIRRGSKIEDKDYFRRLLKEKFRNEANESRRQYSPVKYTLDGYKPASKNPNMD